MRSTDRVVVFWDIDGTLLTTARAGVGAWEDGLAAVTGERRDLSELRTAGLIDPEIARLLLEGAGVEVSNDAVRRLCDAYARALPGRLGERRGHVMEGVAEILAALGGREDVRQYLLTGNLRECALAKLRHYGLEELNEGAFADGAQDRAAVARGAFALARRALGEDARPDHVYVIGDTPHDIACAQAIGARSIGVATGPYPIDQLRVAGAWRAVDRLPPPTEFLGMLGLALR